MSVGFNHIITFDKNGKILDYQKAYTDNYAKELKVFFPLNFNNKDDYAAILSVAINDTFPKQIETAVGSKSDTDLNCYIFDISELYREYKNFNKLGLMKIQLFYNDGKCKFTSESFRA